MILGIQAAACWCAAGRPGRTALEKMPSQHGNIAGGEESQAGFPMVAVAIDKDKSSQSALKWALDNLLYRSQTITLVHVNNKGKDETAAAQAKEMIIPFRCFCTRKDVQCKDIILEDTDIAKAIVELLSQAAIDKLVVGAPSKGGFARRMKCGSDIPTTISKSAPDFCSVYIISKGKVSSMRNAIRPPPPVSSFRAQILSQPSIKQDMFERPPRTSNASTRGELVTEEREMFRSPFTRGGLNQRSYGEISLAETDISFVSSGRPSVDRSPMHHRPSTASNSFERSFESVRTPHWSVEGGEFANYTHESLQSMGEVEAEMKRLRLELKQTMDMYSNACKEAITAKHKAMELHKWKMEEERRLEQARLSEEAALALAEKEKAKAQAAMEAAEASKKIAELEARKRLDAEMKAMKEAEEKKMAIAALVHNDMMYRKYTIEEIEVATDCFAESRKIGEGGYGPVYKGRLDHTPVAIKVLRPDAAQGRSQFQQEIEILSCIRHPNMVLLLGACPEYGCLVYEYMGNGSLDDRLLRRGNTPTIPWQHRFRIAAEIGTGLLFLHQAKPEPFVHRDLKPSNILLDYNYVSKISDVGLARLVPPSVADNVTQYRMTSAAGTFCYIDPEYQQTGMLGIKSDVYSLGILLLQLITGKAPMGLTHYVDRAIDKGEFEDILDPTVPEWPLVDALSLAHVALKCSELRRKDRPDLSKDVLPELNRLRKLGESNMQNCFMGSGLHASQAQTQISIQDFFSSHFNGQSGFDSSRSKSSVSSKSIFLSQSPQR